MNDEFVAEGPEDAVERIITGFTVATGGRGGACGIGFTFWPRFESPDVGLGGGGVRVGEGDLVGLLLVRRLGWRPLLRRRLPLNARPAACIAAIIRDDRPRFGSAAWPGAGGARSGERSRDGGRASRRRVRSAPDLLRECFGGLAASCAGCRERGWDSRRDVSGLP